MMDGRKQIQLLDEFEFQLVALGYLQLSIQLEEYSELNPILRWQEISQLKRRAGFPEVFDCFDSNEPQWDKLEQALTVAKNN